MKCNVASTAYLVPEKILQKATNRHHAAKESNTEHYVAFCAVHAKSNSIFEEAYFRIRGSMEALKVQD